MIICSQWQSYQLEKILEEFYIQKDVSKIQRNAQFSYRKQAYKRCNLNELHDEKKKKYKRTDLN